MKPSGYLPTLDGWRAVAIGSVLICHDVPWRIFGHDPNHWQSLGGNFGVHLFFAISGFLITTRIMEEERLVGRFDLRRFYIRRVFRIQPAAWAYLLVAALVMLLGVYPAQWKAWFGALFLYNNFLFHPWAPASLVGHFWTLSVEEHFYILLSITLFLVKKRRLLVMSLMWLVMVVVARSDYPIAHGWWNIQVASRDTQWQIYMLWLAAVLAVLLQFPAVKEFVRRYLRPWVALTLMLVAVVGHDFGSELLEHAAFRMRYIAQELDFASGYFFALIVISTVYHPKSLLSRLLELKWVRFLGKISYSLYLWHVLFFFSPDDLGGSPSGRVWLMNHLTAWPLRYFLSFGVALLSYYFIEKPFIRLGHRLAPPATPGRIELADLPVEEPLAQPS